MQNPRCIFLVDTCLILYSGVGPTPILILNVVSKLPVNVLLLFFLGEIIKLPRNVCFVLIRSVLVQS